MSFWLQSIPGVSYVQACVNEPNLACTPSLCGKVFLLAQSNPWLYPTKIKLKKSEGDQKNINSLFNEKAEELLKQEKTSFFLPRILVDLSSLVGRIGLGVSLMVIVAPIGTIGNTTFATFYVARFAVRKYGFGVLCSKQKDFIQADWQKASHFAKGALMDVYPFLQVSLAAGIYIFSPLNEVRESVQVMAFFVALYLLMTNPMKTQIAELKEEFMFKFFFSLVVFGVSFSPLFFELFFKSASVGYLLLTILSYATFPSPYAVSDFIPHEYGTAIIKAIGLRRAFGCADSNGFLLKVDPRVDAEEHKNSLLDRLFTSLEQKIAAECNKLKSKKDIIINSPNPSYDEVMRKLEEIGEVSGRQSSIAAELPAIKEMCDSLYRILWIQRNVAEFLYPNDWIDGENPSMKPWKPSFMHSEGGPALKRGEKLFSAAVHASFFDEFRQSSKGHANFMPNVPPAFQNPWKEELAKAAKNIGKEPIQLKDKKQEQQKIYESFRKMVLEGKSPKELIQAGAIKNGLTQKKMYKNISLVVHPDIGAEADKSELQSLFQVLGRVKAELNIE